MYAKQNWNENRNLYHSTVNAFYSDMWIVTLEYRHGCNDKIKVSKIGIRAHMFVV